MNREKNYREIMKGFIYEFPICEFHYLGFDDLMFFSAISNRHRGL